MILLFKKTKLFLFVTVPLWIAAVVLASFTLFRESGYLYPILFLVFGVYILYTIAIMQAGKMHRAYNEILSKECDADRFVELYAEVREEGKKHRSTRFLTESSYATGLHLTGKSDEAQKIVRALIESPDFGKQRATDRADAYVDLGIYSLALGEMEETRESIRKAEEILAAMGVASPDYNRIYREVTRLTHRANIADGIYDEALEYFTDTSREYTTPYTKVNRMNTLAQIYRGMGDTAMLRKCLLYISDNGGTLKMAKNARAELLTLPEAEASGESGDAK